MEKQISIFNKRNPITKDKFEPIKNYTNKPIGGLWSCNYTDKISAWFELNYRTFKYGYTFDLKDEIKIYEINHKGNYDDMLAIFGIYNKNYNKFDRLTHWNITNGSYFSEDGIDFEAGTKEIDVIRFTDKAVKELSGSCSRELLWGYDCECSLILNFDCVNLDTIEEIIINNN